MRGRFLACGAGLFLLLATELAAAQAVGDVVRIDTESGAIEGTLLEKTEEGYVVRFGSTAQLVRTSDVKSIAVVQKAPEGEVPPTTEPLPAPPPTPPPTPEPAPPASTTPPPAPASPPATPEPERAPPPPPTSTAPAAKKGPSNPALVGGGIAALIVGSTGMLVGGILLPIGAVVSSDNTCRDASRSMTFDCEYGSASDMVTGGAIALGVGASLVVGGIVMIVSGSSSSRQKGQAEPLRTAGPSPRSGGVGWTF